MLLNADFSCRVVVEPRQHHWLSSPQPGVERVMLDRVGGEKARATSIVRYAPGSRFPRHEHPGGEEILVLSGVFSEEGAHYPAGWYLRSPPGSGHQPFSDDGAVIFVKLWQMPQDERGSVRIDTRDSSRWTSLDGREYCQLFSGRTEHVAIERLRAGTPVFRGLTDGAEVLVLDGDLCEGARTYGRHCWIRLPPGRYPDFLAGGAGATFYIKTGHLKGPVGKAGAGVEFLVASDTAGSTSY